MRRVGRPLLKCSQQGSGLSTLKQYKRRWPQSDGPTLILRTGKDSTRGRQKWVADFAPAVHDFMTAPVLLWWAVRSLRCASIGPAHHGV